MKVDLTKFKWTREPKKHLILNDKIEIITNPHTDLWKEHIIILETIMRQYFK